MIKYRPHKGELDEAMENSRTFNTLEEMYRYIVSDWNSQGFGVLFKEEDLSITENMGNDTRIDWKENRYVCTKRMGTEIYETPQCIGMCSME